MVVKPVVTLVACLPVAMWFFAPATAASCRPADGAVLATETRETERLAARVRASLDHERARPCHSATGSTRAYVTKLVAIAGPQDVDVLGGLYAYLVDRRKGLEYLGPLLRRGAELGDADAAYQLGRAYRRGIPPIASKDPKAAFFYLRDAVEGGNSPAAFELAELYSREPGMPRDYGKALDLYRRAARAGIGPAMEELGKIYQTGKGVPVDLGRAYVWTALAGFETVPSEMRVRSRIEARLRYLESSLGAARTLEAQRTMSQCLESHYATCPF